MNSLSQLINSIIRLSITFFILYLIFTNFGTFLLIVGSILLIGFYFISKIAKKMKSHGASFKFDTRGFNTNSNFNFNDFNQQNFNQGMNTPHSEIEKAKDFFGFTGEPTKEEIKKRYKELARKYHPDINDHDDTLMKDLNNYKDILMKIYAKK